MAQFTIDSDLIRRLAELLDETGLNEIELGDGARRVRVARAPAAPPPPPAASANAGAQTAPATPAAVGGPEGEAEPPGAVTSPMVGTVYVAPEPGAPPFVGVGDLVEEGQTMFIIEAMKVMNPIRSPRAGRISRILVANGDPVEFGEVLLVIE